MDTGFPNSDAKTDFSRARRRQLISSLARRLRGKHGDVNVILPFDEVVGALGWRGERRLGLQTIDLDSIVGTVDRTRDFDRNFRPTSRKAKQRWERIATAMRRNEAMPPIDVYRIDSLHFVRDGHHRVSVARQLGLAVIEANVTEIITEVDVDSDVKLHDLALKGHERLFFERVPLPSDQRERIRLSSGMWYAGLAEGVEAWGFRHMQAHGEFMTREEIARAWFEEEFGPVVEMLRAAELIGGDSTDAEAYIRVTSLRYFLLRTHDWDEEVIERLREALRRPSPDEDTLVHMMRRDVRA